MRVMKILAAVGGAAPAEPACLGGKSARPIPQIAVWSGGLRGLSNRTEAAPQVN